MNNQVEIVESEEFSVKKEVSEFVIAEGESKSLDNKFLSFIKANYGYFAIPLFIFTIFTIAFIVFDIWPFGTSVIASYDMLAQICPILEHFFDVFQGESGLLHSFHVGSGMDMFGILAYCAVSPFTFMFLLAGEAGSLLMVSIVIPLKFACIGISAFIFLRRYFKTIPQYMQVVLALLYACSGYVYVANTYIIWMDIMMYMPILGAGIIEFSKKGSIRLMIIGLALNIYACFSIVCFSYLTLFPVLVCYVLICKSKEEWREYLSKLCLAFVVAVGVALPILLPSLMAYTKAGRNTGIFSRVFEVLSEEKVLSGELNLHLYEKFTYIFCDSFLVALTLTYFMRAKKGDKLSLFLIVTLVFLLFPCIIDESMLLLNMGSYYSYALRFGFLLSFYFLFVSAKAIEQMISDKLDEVQISKTKSNISLIVVALLSVLGVLFTFRFFKFILDGEYNDSSLINKLYGGFNTVDDAKPFEDFFPLFAHSEGGCEATVILFIVMMLIFIVTAILVWAKSVKIKDVACYLCILALSQTAFFNFSMTMGDRQTGSYQKFDYYSEMLEEIDAIEEDEYYRLKNFKYYISSDSPIILGNYSNTFFSSMADSKNITAAKFFGYGGSLTNSTRGNGGTAFSDAFLNYKYVVFEPADLSSANKTYYTYTGISAHKIPSIKVSYTKNGKNKTATWENVSRETHGKGKWSKLKIVLDGNTFKGYLGEQLVYTITMDDSRISSINAVTKNTFGSFRNLTVTDSQGKKIDGDWMLSEGFEEENGVYTTSKATNSLTFAGSINNVRQIEADVRFSAGTASDDHIGISVTTSSGNIYRIVLEPNVGYMIYKNELAFDGALLLDSAELDFEDKTKKESYQQIADMLCEDESFKLITERISIEETKTIYQKVKDKGVSYKLVRSGIQFEPINAEKGQMLFLSYVNLDGYKVYVNGERREFKENSLDLMMIELDEGVNVVEIKYTSPYYKYILIGIVMACLIVAIAWLIYKKKPVIFDKMSIAIPYLAIGLAVALTIFFFIFPLGVYLKKFLGTYLKMLF